MSQNIRGSKAEFETIFVGGKQKRVRRRPLIEGLAPDEFIRRNADPIWLHQNGLWEDMEPLPDTAHGTDNSANQNVQMPTCKEPEYDEPF